MKLLRLVTILVLSSSTSALAQDFFANSPGPLSEAHSELDNRDGCGKCHQIGKGVTNLLCLDCHTHSPLKEAIARKEGLHATFGNKACRTCHAEHKGRAAATSDWESVGGRASFNHDKTSFSLANEHAKVACAKCHKRKLKSGRNSYIGLTKDCNGCHDNPHKVTSKDLLTMCTDCHGAKGGTARKLKPRDLPFDHEKRTGIALTGKHSKLDCTKCHPKSRMALDDGRTCATCHDSPHGPGWAKSACQKCHGVNAPFTKPTFDHAKDTKFPLEGKHDTKRCSVCHETRDTKPDPTCAGCHNDPHKKRFEKIACVKCHGRGGEPLAKAFDHDSTGFILTGKHESLGCRKCHRGEGPLKFEKMSEGSKCMTCHAHENAHKKEFDDKRCVECHSEGGSKKLVFDHQKDSRFPLTGFHFELGQKNQCEKCHPKNVYRTNKLKCLDCHKDSHEGTLGETCDKCHSTEVKFPDTKKDFPHDSLTSFVLEKKHLKVECEKCHPKRRYKLPKDRCVDCHADDDPHKGNLGTDCGDCHVPDSGAPKFVHDSMTKFARTGAHKDVKCFGCHQEPIVPPPPLGWMKTLTESKVNRLFPVRGTECAECHQDVHNGERGSACESCHTPESFRTASRAVHDTGSFRLQNTHDRLKCDQCHLPAKDLEGLGERCDGCHAEDDVHDGALGPFCGECHGQTEWNMTRFNHASTGYALKGAHRRAECRDCHSAGRFVGIPTDCSRCHERDAGRVTEPVHGPQLAECGDCHHEAAFRPARVTHPWWPLTGVHVTIPCGNCHPGGQYVGAPNECFACHETDFVNPRNDPDHVREGFSTTCDTCHTTATWEGARRP